MLRRAWTSAYLDIGLWFRIAGFANRQGYLEHVGKYSS